MNQQYLEFSIKHQKIKRTDEFFVVGGSKNYLKARFTFCDDWSGETPTAIFSCDTGAYYQILENGECLVPWEVLREQRFFVSAMAGSRITSNTAMVKVCPCGIVDPEESSSPTPGAYEELLEDVVSANQVYDALIEEDMLVAVADADGALLADGEDVLLW